ncbi:hypothetical protein [Azoarcus sp. KH32C]|uniref:COG4648 family protein n=1 Tax=Azoarcus sp. KH32C TaxID=748247 RepID=UPI0002386286|nr:hypothetical protein [Azoarcus sp. KH32C]BAL24096.1 hypothetical protein AZKH_1783 [Azoarcus sp. KH32C]
MNPGIARAARVLAIGLIVAASAVAAHYASALVESSDWGAMLAIGPFAAGAAAFAWHSPQRPVLLALLAAATAALAALWPTLAHNVDWLFFVQHFGLNLLLAIGFGRTLAAGRKPLCTGIAEMIHGEISPASTRYTRQVTLAWTVFFGMMTGTSAILFVCAPATVWSTFANLLNWPLVGVMFVAEYLVRQRLLPEDRSNIIDAIRAYRRSTAASAASRIPSPFE